MSAHRHGVTTTLIAMAFLTIGPPPLFAQLPAATIRGVVKDSGGAVLPGTTVTVRNIDTGLTAMVAMLPPRTPWTLCVGGPNHLDMAAIAIARGGHVRTRLENNVELSPGKPARTQGECVGRIVQLARSLGREIASPHDARQLLGLPRRPEVVKS